MKIILDIEIPNEIKPLESYVPEEVVPCILQIKKHIADRLGVLSSEIETEKSGVIVYITKQKTVFAVGFTEDLKTKIEESFDSDDMRFYESKLNF